ncbi:hypothetical protein [Massilia sp. S19_KUP03_FR1]|uniref:hypothetical protein n=1 Tax=Massilia sp. S19_KUP03_FR1 TaxID=3025503 RepID=UPI002FCD7E5F
MQLARRFIQVRIRGLAARMRRLVRITPRTIGLRAQDMRYAPSPTHFAAANRRLGAIDANIERRFVRLAGTWARAPLQRALVDVALVEREIDRARRAFGLFFEVFAQRGSSFAPVLAAHDSIAIDCYAAVRQADPNMFDARLIKPFCYMEHGYSPATMRRGVTLNRLLGEPNPFPLIRIPWDRDHPWQAVFLHEVAHNLQADLGVWQENRQAVVQRILGAHARPVLASVYGRWHKEIFADLAAILLGGPAAAWGMAEFLLHPAPRVLTYRPGSAHPTGYLRVLMLAEMLRRLGFAENATRLARVWRTLYNPARGHRLPVALLDKPERVIAQVVDEIAFQTRRNLAQRALVDVIPFHAADHEAIIAGARLLMQGQAERVQLPPRFLVSAGAYALASGKIAPRALSRQLVGMMTELAAPDPRALPARPARPAPAALFH